MPSSWIKLITKLFLFALLFPLIATPSAHAAREARYNLAHLQNTAKRMGIEPSLLTDPEAYLQQHTREQRYQNGQQQRSTTIQAPTLNSSQIVWDTRTTHAMAAFGGVVEHLADVQRKLSWYEPQLAQGTIPTPLIQQIQQLSSFIDSNQQAIADVEQQQKAHHFFAEMRTQLGVLQAYLDTMPDTTATSATWIGWLARLETHLQGPLTQTNDKNAPLAPAGHVWGTGRMPYTQAGTFYLQEVLGAHHLPTALIPLAQRFIQQGQGPTPEDTQATPDIHLTPEIQALATSFEADPLAIFNYVRRNYDTELYYGSKKGSIGVWYEQAGNDIDLASFLIALYRAAGIPARYVTGNVWLSSEQAQALAHTTTTQAAADIFSTAGIPAIYVERSVGEPVVQIEHTWVQVWLPYERYRGILEADTGSSWIDLDPFLKDYQFRTPVDLTGAPDFDPLTYLQANSEFLPVEYWQNELRAFIELNNILCTTFAHAMRSRSIVAPELELLPARLPLRQFETLGTFSSIPDHQRYTLGLALTTMQGIVEAQATARLPEIYGQRIDISFPPASSADEATISEYGTIYDTPAYLINVRPSIHIDGNLIATGNPLRPGTEYELVVTFQTPGMQSTVPEMTHTMNAGGIYVVGLDYQTIPQQLIDEAEAHLGSLEATSDEALAQSLHLMLLRYFSEYDRGLNEVTGILQHHYIRDLGAGFATNSIKVETSFGTPVSIGPGYGLIDIPKLSYTPYDLQGSQAEIMQILQLTGYHSSAWEHQIIQEIFGVDAVSSVKGLKLALEDGQTLVTVTNANEIPSTLPNDVRTSILNALNQGWHALVPQQAITRYEWNGVGYVTYDPNTGTASYLISGNLNGGEGTGGDEGNYADCGTGATAECPNAWEILWIIIRAISDDGRGGGNNRGQAAPAVTGNIAQDIQAPNGYQSNVNLSNGNVFLQAGDLAVLTYGIPVGIGRSYNSRSPDSGMFGRGWTSSYDQRLIIGTSTIRFLDESGASYIFSLDNGVYTAPPGFFGELTSTASGYEIVMKDGLTFRFATDGRLLQQADLNGNTVTLNYSAQNQLESVTDSAGRTALTFTYTTSGGEARVASVTDLENRTVTYSYIDGNLTEVAGLDQQTTAYSYNAQGQLTTSSDSLGNSTHYYYDGDGRVYRHIDPLGHVTSYSFDAYNGQTVITDSRGNNTLVSVDEVGRPQSITDPLGNTVHYERDADHNVTAITDAMGNTTSMTYDADGNMLSKTDTSGAVITYTYNEFGSISSTAIDGEVVETNTYDAQGNLLSSVNANGNTTSATYDAQGRVLTSIDERGTETTYTYIGAGISGSSTVAVFNPVTGQTRDETTMLTLDDVGRIQSSTNANGVQTTMSTDNLGRLTNMQTPDSLPMEIQYDLLGRPTAMSTNGTTQTIAYDAAGRMIALADGAGNTTTMEYDAAGNMIRSVDPMGSVRSTTYDAMNREILRTDGLGNVTQIDHCADLPVICGVIDANGNGIRTEYDELGRPHTTTDALGNTTTYRYNAAGWLEAMTDAEGHTTSYSYDNMGNLASVTDGLSNTTSFEYLPGTSNAGREGGFPNGLTRMTNANGQSWTYDYDSKGRLVRETDPEGHATIFTYDPVGRLTERTTPNGDTITYDYDQAGRLLSMGGALTATMQYDERGNRTLLENATVRLTYTYDELNRLTQVSNDTLSKTLIINYNARGQRATMVDAENASTIYDYDAAGRLHSITDPQGGVTIYSYDPAGRRTQVQYPNGVVTTTDYDAANRLTAMVTHGPDETVISAYSYTYDAVGNRTSVTDLNGNTTSYVYDATYRLISVAGPNISQSYTYDAVGNRTSMTSNGTTTSYTYSAANRLLSTSVNSNTTSYTYDNNGNLLSQVGPEGTISYQYDALNRLLELTTPTSRTLQFAYDGDGTRVQQTLDGVTTWFLVESDQVIADYTSAGTRSARYVHGRSLDEILSITTTSGTQYVHYDGLGSATRTTNAQGQILGRQAYDVFGTVTSSQGWNTRYGFTGREHIPHSDLMHYRTRYYDTSDGRFLSVDSVRGDLLTPPSLHRYTYVHNNPVNYIDPMGTFAFPFGFVPALILAGVGVLLVGQAGFIIREALLDVINDKRQNNDSDKFAYIVAAVTVGIGFIITGFMLIMTSIFMIAPNIGLSVPLFVGYFMKLNMVAVLGGEVLALKLFTFFVNQSQVPSVFKILENVIKWLITFGEIETVEVE